MPHVPGEQPFIALIVLQTFTHNLTSMLRSITVFITAFGAVASGAQNLVLDPTFSSSSTSVSQGITAMVLQPDGRIVCGGGFDAYSGVPREDLVRLYPDGTVDMGFAPMPTTGSGASVQALYLQADGKILVGGAFAEMNGSPASGLTRLEPNGTNDAGFSHTIDANLFAVASVPNGNVFVGGDIFTPEAGILALSGAGSAVAYPPLVPSTQCLRVQPDGKLLVGLSDAPYLARLEQDGTLDATFTPDINATFGSVIDMALHADGHITIVGDFTSVDGQPRARIARLMPDGSLDASFDPGLGLDAMAIAIDTLPDGDVLVAGYFTSYNGTAANGNLLRINSDGSLDTSSVATGIRDILVQPDGKVLLSGALMTYSGAFRNGVMRLMPDPSTDVARVDSVPVRAWPSPASSTLHLDGATRGVPYTVYNAMGWEVLAGTLLSSTLDVSSLASGSYSLQMFDDRRHLPIRFVKE